MLLSVNAIADVASVLLFPWHRLTHNGWYPAEQVFEPEVKRQRCPRCTRRPVPPRCPSCPRQLCSRWPSKSTLSRLRTRHRFSEEQGSFRAAPCCSLSYRAVPWHSVPIQSVPYRFASIQFSSSLSNFVPFCSHAHHALHVGLGPNLCRCLMLSHVDSCCSMLSHVVSCSSHVVLMPTFDSPAVHCQTNAKVAVDRPESASVPIFADL
jgi:hypothetical protein